MRDISTSNIIMASITPTRRCIKCNLLEAYANNCAISRCPKQFSETDIYAKHKAKNPAVKDTSIAKSTTPQPRPRKLGSLSNTKWLIYDKGTNRMIWVDR